jgi:hypothetical protein
VNAQVDYWLADQRGVSTTGILMIFGLSLMVPVLGLLYIKLEKAILRRAGIPPLEEHIASLKLPDQDEQAPIELRKAA